MAIQFTCPECLKNYAVNANLAGRQSRCDCGHIIVVPAAIDTNPITSPLTGTELSLVESDASTTLDPFSVPDEQLPQLPALGLQNGPLNPVNTPVQQATQIAGASPEPTVAPQPVNNPVSIKTKETSTPTKQRNIQIAILAGGFGVISLGFVIACVLMFGGEKASIPKDSKSDARVATTPPQTFPNSGFEQQELISDNAQHATADIPAADANAIVQEDPIEENGDGQPQNNPLGIVNPNAEPINDNSAAMGDPIEADDPVDANATMNSDPPENIPTAVVASDVYDGVAKLPIPLPSYQGTEHGESRVWTSADQKFNMTGVFDGVKQGDKEPEVNIVNGNAAAAEATVTVPISMLSIEDRAWFYKKGQYDYMRHIRGQHENIVDSFRRYTPDDYETPTPFDVDWVTGIPELWGPVFSVDLVIDRTAIARGNYDQKYISLKAGFLEPRENWVLTTDGQGWLSNFHHGSESIVLVWNKEFVDAKLGVYTSPALRKFCIDVFAEKYPTVFLAVIKEYGFLGAIDFFDAVIPVFFETSIVGKLVGNVLYAKSFSLKVRDVLGGLHISADDEVGYQEIFHKELLIWLAIVRARTAEGTDLNGDGIINSSEHAIGYFEENEGGGVVISELVNSLRGLTQLSNLNRNMNKFSRMVLQFKQVDQNNDDRITMDDYANADFVGVLNIDFVKEATTLKQDQRATLLVLLTAGIRPKFYVHFADKFGPAMLSLSFAIRSKQIVDTNNPYKGKELSEIDELIHQKSPTQADFAASVFDLLMRRELQYFRYFLQPHPVSNVLQFSDLKDYHFLGVFRDQVTELDWITSHINLMDSKLVDIIPLKLPTEALPSGAGNIYRYVGPHGTLNLWIDGFIEHNYTVRGVFWDHSVNEAMNEHLWTWKEGDIEYDIHGTIVNVQYIGDKIMLVVKAEDGEVMAIPIYRMPKEMRRFARWALAFFRTDRLYSDLDLHDRKAISVNNGYGAASSAALLEADKKWGNSNGKASHIELTIYHYYDTGKTVQFDIKEVDRYGKEVGAVRNLPGGIVEAEPFLSGLITYEGDITTPSTQQIYNEIPGGILEPTTP